MTMNLEIVDKYVKDETVTIFDIMEPCSINLTRYIRSHEMDVEAVQERIEDKMQREVYAKLQQHWEPGGAQKKGVRVVVPRDARGEDSLTGSLLSSD